MLLRMLRRTFSPNGFITGLVWVFQQGQLELTLSVFAGFPGPWVEVRSFRIYYILFWFVVEFLWKSHIVYMLSIGLTYDSLLSSIVGRVDKRMRILIYCLVDIYWHSWLTCMYILIIGAKIFWLGKTDPSSL